MDKYILNPEAWKVWSHGRGSITAGGGWHYNGWREYTKIYILGRTKAFLPVNVVCLDVREIAVAQRWCTGIMLVHACLFARTLTHMHTHPQIYFPFGRRREWGEQKQCSEADVITKGNTSRVSPSLSDPHGGSKSELIRVLQNGGNLPAEVASAPCSIQMWHWEEDDGAAGGGEGSGWALSGEGSKWGNSPFFISGSRQSRVCQRKWDLRWINSTSPVVISYTDRKFS